MSAGAVEICSWTASESILTPLAPGRTCVLLELQGVGAMQGDLLSLGAKSHQGYGAGEDFHAVISMSELGEEDLCCIEFTSGA